MVKRRRDITQNVLGSPKKYRSEQEYCESRKEFPRPLILGAVADLIGNKDSQDDNAVKPIWSMSTSLSKSRAFFDSQIHLEAYTHGHKKSNSRHDCAVDYTVDYNSAQYDANSKMGACGLWTKAHRLES